MTDRTLPTLRTSFKATVKVPGDKSLSHRALIFAAMAEGDSFVSGTGTGADIASTASILRQFGVEIDLPQVRSPGIGAWQVPDGPLDCGNSGTTMRLLAGVLSTSSVTATLVGDESLSARPMTRLVEPLRALGGVIETTAGTAPLRVGGATDVTGAAQAIEIASAQVRTAFELAALSGGTPSEITSPPGFRDHTERWLASIGRGEWGDGATFAIYPGTIPPARYDVPGDPSSAAYLWALAAITPGSQILTPGISLNPGRLGFLEILGDMGVEIQAGVTGSIGNDPIGDVLVRAGDLRAVSVGGDTVAAALDELPLLAVVAAFAEGITTVSDASELRAKESDRIATTTEMLRAVGGGIEPSKDGFQVVGTGFLDGGTIPSRGDHRIAMAGSIAALRASEPVVVTDAGAADVSWPGFYDVLEDLCS